MLKKGNVKMIKKFLKKGMSKSVVTVYFELVATNILSHIFLFIANI